MNCTLQILKFKTGIFSNNSASTWGMLWLRHDISLFLAQEIINWNVILLFSRLKMHMQYNSIWFGWVTITAGVILYSRISVNGNIKWNMINRGQLWICQVLIFISYWDSKTCCFFLSSSITLQRDLLCPHWHQRNYFPELRSNQIAST